MKKKVIFVLTNFLKKDLLACPYLDGTDLFGPFHVRCVKIDVRRPDVKGDLVHLQIND